MTWILMVLIFVLICAPDTQIRTNAAFGVDQKSICNKRGTNDAKCRVRGARLLLVRSTHFCGIWVLWSLYNSCLSDFYQSLPGHSKLLPLKLSPPLGYLLVSIFSFSFLDSDISVPGDLISIIYYANKTENMPRRVSPIIPGENYFIWFFSATPDSLQLPATVFSHTL